MRFFMVHAWKPAPGSIRLVVIQEDDHMNEMDRIRFNLGWYFYKLRAWWRGA